MQFIDKDQLIIMKSVCSSMTTLSFFRENITDTTIRVLVISTPFKSNGICFLQDCMLSKYEFGSYNYLITNENSMTYRFIVSLWRIIATKNINMTELYIIVG